MRKLQLRERTFKRLAFATTILGVVIMAIGLQQGLTTGSWVVALILFLGGGTIALSSTFFRIVPEAGFTVTLYTREGCTLCEAARAFLVGKKAEYDYDLWEVDVDQDALAEAKYGDWVPVASVGDEELFRAVPDYPRLEAKLRELADRRVRR